MIWINHHAAIARVMRADHALLVLNLLLLMTIAALPFTTALMAEYLRVDDGQHLAAAVYAGSLLLMSLAFFALQRHMLVGRAASVASAWTRRRRRCAGATRRTRALRAGGRRRRGLVLRDAGVVRGGRPLLRAAGHDGDGRQELTS